MCIYEIWGIFVGHITGCRFKEYIYIYVHAYISIHRDMYVLWQFENYPGPRLMRYAVPRAPAVVAAAPPAAVSAARSAPGTYHSF